jgi:TIR domain
MASLRPSVPEEGAIFFLHASEDTETVARPLATELGRRGWIVWLDEFELVIGDSLRAQINAALQTARAGAAILSPAFFAKRWPQHELAGLMAREREDSTTLILPVWHNMDATNVARASPLLADRLAVCSSAGDHEGHATQLLTLVGAPTFTITFRIADCAKVPIGGVGCRDTGRRRIPVLCNPAVARSRRTAGATRVSATDSMPFRIGLRLLRLPASTSDPSSRSTRRREADNNGWPTTQCECRDGRRAASGGRS